MKDADAKLLVDALLDDRVQQEQLQQKVRDSEPFATELASLQQTWDSLAELPEVATPSGMQKRFYNQLDAYAKGRGDQAVPEVKRPSLWSMLGPWLFPTVGLMAGLFFGVLLGTSTSKTDQTQLGLDSPSQFDWVGLLANSPAERLSVVQASRDLQDPDERVLQALLHVLRSDESVNVRLSAVDALVAVGNSAVVREGLIRALPVQESPMVQIALIDGLIRLQGEAAEDSLQHLLEVDNVNPMVRKHASDSLQAWR